MERPVTFRRPLTVLEVADLAEALRLNTTAPLP